MFRNFEMKPLIAAMIAASLLSACGGGGGGNDNDDPTVGGGATSPGVTNPTPVGGGSDDNAGGNTNPGTTNPDPTNPGTTNPTPGAMACAEGAGVQCSGATILATDNNVVLTDSGVQVLGASATDTAGSAFGLQFLDLPTAKADVRLRRAENGQTTAITMVLDNLGIKWGTPEGAERPQIIETFSTQAGRVQLNAAGAAEIVALPRYPDTFYDFTVPGTGTAARYANNVNYPLDASTNCQVSGDLPAGCETTGVHSRPGDFRLPEGGNGQADSFEATRYHNDGDIHAGAAQGLPFPGSKGYRSINGFSYNYANLGTWTTQDTVTMAEWGGYGPDEHNTARRGAIAFGDVTDSAAVPTTGTATYSGIIYGSYGTSPAADPTPVYGRATATVDFATRQMTITINNVITYDATEAAVPLVFNSTLTGGAAPNGLANYLTGAITETGYAGGISARYFGPVVTTGTTGAGPAELGGALRFTTTGNTFIGAFIARKN